MSHDLLVATRIRPGTDALASFGKAPLGLEGQFTRGSNVIVTFAGAPPLVADADGPTPVEPDDLPDDLAGVVPKAAWLVEIHVPGGLAAGETRPIELAIHLARLGEGAVYDPQLDRLVWPPGVTPQARGSTQERIRIVNLDWWIPASTFPEDAPDRWLRLAERLPAAMPARYGPYEPMRGRLDRDGAAAFGKAWREEAAKPFGGHLFWSAGAGGFGGSVFFADRRMDNRPARLGRVVHLGIELDARPLYRDEEQADRLVDFFADVAESFGAAYGSGCVTRDAILARGRLAFDPTSELPPLPRASWWVGLPALPTWLAWFGPPYRDLVRAAFDNVASDERSTGLLARAGSAPLDIEELANGATRLPAELLARQKDGAPLDPSVRIGLTKGPPSEPAEVIPWID